MNHHISIEVTLDVMNNVKLIEGVHYTQFPASFVMKINDYLAGVRKI